MTVDIKYRAVLLFEDELRAAASLLKAAREEQDEAKQSALLGDALLACEVALLGADDGN